jgi:branched-chain amino acid transport system substrate-binding protein
MQIRAAILATALMLAPLAARAADLLIGVPGSMTGPNAFRGEQQQRGVGKAVADLNALGGVLGQPLRIEVVDDFCDGAQAVAVAAKLVADGAVFIAGHLCSGASIPAAEVYAQAGIPMISPSSTNPALTEAGHPNVFRVVGRDDMQGMIAGDYLAKRWAGQDIAILHDGLPYGQGLARLTKARLNERGVTEVVFDAIAPGEADYSKVVARLRAAGVDVLYYGGYATEAGLILRQAHDDGYDLRMVGGDGVNNDDFWLIAGPAGEGTLVTFAPDPRDNPQAAAVVAGLRAAGFEPGGYTLHAYAAVQAWAQAVTKAGSANPGPVIKALHAGTFETVLGTIGFDRKGDVTGLELFVWYVWTDGKPVPVK